MCNYFSGSCNLVVMPIKSVWEFWLYTTYKHIRARTCNKISCTAEKHSRWDWVFLLWKLWSCMLSLYEFCLNCYSDMILSSCCCSWAKSAVLKGNSIKEKGQNCNYFIEAEFSSHENGFFSIENENTFANITIVIHMDKWIHSYVLSCTCHSPLIPFSGL